MQFLGVKQASKLQRGKLIFDPVRNCLLIKLQVKLEAKLDTKIPDIGVIEV